MIIRTVKALALGTALVLTTAMPAAAQTVGVGLTFGSIGAAVDYSKPFRTLSGSNVDTLGWVAEVGFSHEGCGNALVDCGVNQATVQGGVRVNGMFSNNDRLKWHAQGLLGLAHTNVTGVLDDACDITEAVIGDYGCGSSNDFIFTPGFGVDYLMSGNMSFRGQVDLIAGSFGSNGRLWIGLSWTK